MAPSKPGVLVAADDQRIHFFRRHCRADIYVTTVNFFLRGHDGSR